jgi:hypothetical protein
MTNTCVTCKRWERHRTAAPWFPPSVGRCSLVLPPYVMNLLEQLVPSYVATDTQQDDTCSFHEPGRVEPPPPVEPKAAS